MSNSETQNQPIDESSSSDAKTKTPDGGDTTNPIIDRPSATPVATDTPQAHMDEEKPKDAPSKVGMIQKLSSKLPTYNQFKKTLKADIALTVTLVLVLDQTTNKAIGQGTLLASVAMVFFCPVKSVGLQLEMVIVSLLLVMLSAAWCFLGMFLANLSRDHTTLNPLQVSSGVILEIFLFFGTFFFNWIRTAYPKANFAGILGCIVLIFGMTTSAAVPLFEPAIIWVFVIPICIGAGLAIVIDILIWPENTANNCIEMFSVTLDSFNKLLTQQSEVFLRDPDLALPEQATPLSVIHNQLQGNIIMLIESKRAVQREVFYSKLTANDFSYLTKLVKSMRLPLHGIGLSRVIEHEMYDAQSGGRLKKWQTATLDMYPPLDDTASLSDSQLSDNDSSFESDQLLQEYKQILNTIRPICTALASECTTTVSECMVRLKCLHSGKPVDTNISDQIKYGFNGGMPFSQRMREAIQTFEKDRTKGMDNIFRNKLTERDPHRAMLLLLLFQYNLREYAEKVLQMTEFITTLEKERCKRRVCWPNITFRKWIKGDTREDDITAIGSQLNEGDAAGRLARTASRVNHVHTRIDASLGPSSCEQDYAGHFFRRDPDVLAPSTWWERFFYGLYKVKSWLLEPGTLTVLKTSIGCILLALPAYFPSSALWYYEWRGQWAVITLVFWMFPSSGLLIFGFFLRLSGTVAGAVAGIVVWEICQGVTYAIAVLMFIANYVLYHLFFFKPFWRVVILMTQITMLLVVAYRYNYVLADNPEPVWNVAGKRCLLVVIGVIAASVMYCIPFPITGRVELRYRLAITVRDIGTLYSTLIYAFENIAPDRPITEKQRKKFQKLTLDIQRQIALERTLLAHAKYEPPLRGKYPQDKYAKILDSVDNMADMISGMGTSLEKLSPIWRADLSRKAKSARNTYIATIMTGFKLVSAALAAKTSLPPHLHYPKDALAEFGHTIRHLPTSESSYFQDPTFTVFAAYQLNSSSFVMELQKLLETIQDLVGVDTPGHWMEMA